jgi:hypothetical protein
MNYSIPFTNGAKTSARGVSVMAESVLWAGQEGIDS